MLSKTNKALCVKTATLNQFHSFVLLLLSVAPGNYTSLKMFPVFINVKMAASPFEGLLQRRDSALQSGRNRRQINKEELQPSSQKARPQTLKLPKKTETIPHVPRAAAGAALISSHVCLRLFNLLSGCSVDLFLMPPCLFASLRVRGSDAERKTLFY